MNNLYVYDIETYPNVFTVTILRPSDSGLWRFEISNRKNDGVAFFQLLTAIKNSNGRMVGFNNVGFDYPIIHQLILKSGHITAYELYHKRRAIINGGDWFGSMVWPDDRFIPQIDLFKIHHFDNQARSTSLKMLEFNMRSENIQDLPFKPGFDLTDDQIDQLIPYNDHDVFETAKFLEKSLHLLEFRDELSAKYDRDFTNHNDTKIGKDYFIMELERLGVQCFHRPNGKKEPLQTIRSSIELNSVILQWVQFNSVQFRYVLNWLKSQSITKTKGVFEFIEVSPEMAAHMDPRLMKVHGLTVDDLPDMKPGKTRDNAIEKGLVLTKLSDDFMSRPDLHRFTFLSGWEDKSGLNCIIDGFQYDFGTGGIHGSVESQTVRSDANYQIIDLDVASYYPNLAIANRFYPAHLGERFCDIYQDVYNQRKQFPKGTPENAMLKLALNGVYGDSNSQYSPFYDPAYTMAITINGQLLLCLLAEQLAAVPGLSMVQINTDGLTVKCPHSHIDTLMFIASTWEQMTGLELERADYKRMFIRDVNNYIAEYEDGKLKRKGAYGYGKDLDWSQNHSFQIVAIAAEAALVHGTPVEHTVRNHTDVMDFMGRTKVPRNSRLILETKIDESTTHHEQLQNITRYYASTTGGQLVKMMPPTPAQLAKNPNTLDRRIGIEAGQLVRPCNNVPVGFTPVNLDYDYYINEANKLVEPLL